MMDEWDKGGTKVKERKKPRKGKWRTCNSQALGHKFSPYSLIYLFIYIYQKRVWFHFAAKKKYHSEKVQPCLATGAHKTDSLPLTLITYSPIHEKRNKQGKLVCPNMTSCLIIHDSDSSYSSTVICFYLLPCASWCSSSKQLYLFY